MPWYSYPFFALAFFALIGFFANSRRRNGHGMVYSMVIGLIWLSLGVHLAG